MKKKNTLQVIIRTIIRTTKKQQQRALTLKLLKNIFILCTMVYMKANERKEQTGMKRENENEKKKMVITHAGYN